MTPSEVVPIARIRLDGGTQPRAALNFGVVEDYCEAMKAGAKFPPVVVFYDGTDYWLADGFHRVKAAYAANCETIECELHQGTHEDAQWHSFGANRTNGLHRTNLDKQRAVKAALRHPTGALLSDRQIAKHVGVSDQMVRDYRHEMGSTSKVLKSTKRAGADGRTIDVAKIGRAKRSTERTGSAEPSAEPANEEGSNPASVQSVRKTRAQKIEHVTRLTLTFFDTTKHFARLINWLGETAGEFDAAERLLAETMSAIAAVSAEIERKAIEADPLNRDRLGIQEKRS